MKGVMRKTSSFGPLLIIALFSIVAISIAWASLSESLYGDISEMLAVISRGLFTGISFAILLLSSLIVLSTTATMITTERENQTFDLLVVTGLSKKQIILGKLVSAIGFICFLIMATLPLLSICFILGGVSLQDIVIAYVSILTTLAAVGMVGIMASAIAKDSRKAQGLGFLIIFLLFLGIPWAIELIRAFTGRFSSTPNIIWLFNPYMNFFRILFRIPLSPFAGGFLMAINPFYLILFTNSVLLAVGFIIANKYFISPEKEKTKIRKKYIESREILEKRRKRFPYYLIDPLKKNREIQDDENPAFVKEKRYTFASRLVFIIRFAYITLLCGVVFCVSMPFTGIDEEFIVVYYIIGTLIGTLFTLIISSNLVVDEIEKNTFDSLRSTMLKPAEVFWSKIGFTFMCAALILTTYTVPGILFYIIGGNRWFAWDTYSELPPLSLWLLGLNTMIMSVVLACIVGILASSIGRTKKNAQANAISLFALLSVSPTLITGMLYIIDEFLLHRKFSFDYWEMERTFAPFLAGFMSPFYYMATAIHKASSYGDNVLSYIITSNISFLIFVAILFRLTYLRFKKIWIHGLEKKSILSQAFNVVRKRIWAR